LRREAPNVIEAAARGDIRDARPARRAEQLLPRSVEAEIAQELHRHSTDEATEMSLQSAATDTAGQCDLVDCPAAGQIGSEQIERPLERAGYELRSHAGPLRPQQQ
jgi:hypothetical protein